MKISFRPLARFVARKPLVVVALIAAVTIGLGSGMARIAVDTDMTDDIPDTVPEKMFYDQVGEIFPSDDFLIVALTDSRGAFSGPALAEIKSLTDTVLNLRGVKSVLSLSSAGLIRGTEQGLEIEEAMPVLPVTEAEIAAFRARVENDDMVGALLGKDGKSTAMIVTLKDGIDAEPLPRVLVSLPKAATVSAEAKAALAGALAAIPGTKRVYNPDSESDRYDAAVGFNLDLAADKKGAELFMLEAEEGADLAAMTAAAKAALASAASGGIAGAKAKAVKTPVTFYDRVQAAIRLSDKKSDGPIYVSGSRAVSGIVGKLLITDLSMLFPIVILVIAIVLFLSFRSLRGVLLPLGNVVLSVVWAMGLMGLLGQDLTMATMILPIILIAVGTAYTIHVLNRYFEELAHTTDKPVAVEATLTHVALPVFLAGATTFIGFGSLIVSSIDALKMFGVLSALGILFALILSLTLTPALMVLLPLPKAKTIEKHGKSRLAELLAGLGRFVGNRPIPVLVVSLVVVAFFALFTPRVSFETNTINSFKKGSEVRTSSDYLNENFTGITVMTVVVAVDEEGAILDPAVLRAMDGLQERVDALRVVKGKVVGPESPLWKDGTAIVGGSQSIVTFVKGINKALNAGDEAFEKVPDDLTPIAVTTERYSLVNGVLREFDYDTKEFLAEYAEGADFRVEGGQAFLKMDGNERRIDLATGTATDLIPGRAYAGQLVFQYENSGDPENIEAFIDNPRKTARVNVFVKTASSTLIGQIQAITRDYIAKNFPAGSRADITGLSNLTLAILRLLVQSQISSVLASLVVVFLFITLMSRSFVEGLFSIVPLAASLIINFGLMGLAGISVDISTATIASIGIGIGIDYTLHFMERLKSMLCTLDYKNAVIETMRTTGQGIFFNALAVAAGFSALLFSQLRGNMFMGLLLSLIMLTSSLFAVTLLPALLAIMKPKFLDKPRLAATCDEASK